MPLQARSEYDDAPYQSYSTNSIKAMTEGDMEVARKVAKKKKKKKMKMKAGVGTAVKAKKTRRMILKEMAEELNK